MAIHAKRDNMGVPSMLGTYNGAVVPVAVDALGRILTVNIGGGGGDGAMVKVDGAVVAELDITSDGEGNAENVGGLNVEKPNTVHDPNYAHINPADFATAVQGTTADTAYSETETAFSTQTTSAYARVTLPLGTTREQIMWDFLVQQVTPGTNALVTTARYFGRGLIGYRVGDAKVGASNAVEAGSVSPTTGAFTLVFPATANYKQIVLGKMYLTNTAATDNTARPLPITWGSASFTGLTAVTINALDVDGVLAQLAALQSSKADKFAATVTPVTITDLNTVDAVSAIDLNAITGADFTGSPTQTMTHNFECGTLVIKTTGSVSGITIVWTSKNQTAWTSLISSGASWNPNTFSDALASWNPATHVITFAQPNKFLSRTATPNAVSNHAKGLVPSFLNLQDVYNLLTLQAILNKNPVATDATLDLKETTTGYETLISGAGIDTTDPATFAETNNMSPGSTTWTDATGGKYLTLGAGHASSDAATLAAFKTWLGID